MAEAQDAFGHQFKELLNIDQHEHDDGKDRQ